jgi:hypothetical protein
VRRLSQLIKFNESIDGKNNDQSLFKIASELTNEQRYQLDAFDQLGNYVDWLSKLTKDTDYNHSKEKADEKSQRNIGHLLPG